MNLKAHIKALALVALLFLTSSWLMAQEQADCKSILKQAYQHLELTDVKPGQEVFTIYTTVNYNKDGSRYKERYKQRVSNNYYMVEGEHTQFYADQKQMVSILNDQKRIILSPSTKKETAANPFKMLWQIIDSHTERMDCKIDAGGAFWLLSIHLNATGQKRTKIKSIQYKIQKDTYQIEQMQTFFVSTHSIRQTKYQLLQLDIRPEQLVKPVLDYIYDEGKRIRPTYKDYKILDYRK